MHIHTFAIDQHLILFRPADQRLFILNPTASWIWQALGGDVSVSEIIQSLAAHYTISTEDIEADINATLQTWLSQGLNPSSVNEAEEQLPVQPVTVKMELPANSTSNFQTHFQYGRSNFTLDDYTPDLKPNFRPLLASLGTVEQKNTVNRIAVYKDRDNYVIGCNEIELERTPLEAVAVGRVVQTMVEYGYPDAAWMAFIHASAGGLDGHGFIFSGISGSGKSTLMAALAQSGWTYWCDDIVPLDSEERAGAVPLGHCLKSGSWDPLVPYYPELADQSVFHRFGREVRYQLPDSDKTGFTETMPVHRLVFPVYSPDGDQSLDPIPPIEGLQRLIDAQTWISPDPVLAGKLISWISTIPAYSLNFHSLDWAIDQLRELAQDEQL